MADEGLSGPEVEAGNEGAEQNGGDGGQETYGVPSHEFLSGTNTNMDQYGKASAPLSDDLVQEAFYAMSDVDPESAASLQREWGSEAGTNIGLARGFAEAFIPSDLYQELSYLEGPNGEPFLDHPLVVKAAATIARRLAGGDGSTLSQLATRGARMTDQGRQKALDRIDEIHDLQSTDPMKYTSRKVQGELQALYASAYGTAPIQDGEGRSLLR